jgi:predicted Zn-dependent peptidase
LRADELSVEKVLERLEAVSLAELSQLAQQLFTTNKPRLAIIGDFDSKVEKELRATID